MENNKELGLYTLSLLGSIGLELFLLLQSENLIDFSKDHALVAVIAIIAFELINHYDKKTTVEAFKNFPNAKEIGNQELQQLIEENEDKTIEQILEEHNLPVLQIIYKGSIRIKVRERQALLISLVLPTFLAPVYAIKLRAALRNKKKTKQNNLIN